MATTRPNWQTTRARLRRLKVRRVDLVPAGANPESHVVLAKARTESTDPVRPARTPSPKENPMIPEALAPLADLSEDDITAIGTYVDDLKTKLEAEQSRADAALAALAKAQEEPEGDDDDAVLKGLPESAVALIQKARDEAAEAKAAAAEVTKAERERVFKARAASMVKLTGGDEGADRLGAILNKAEAALPADDYAELERTLLAADTQVEKAETLFKATGSDGDTPGGDFVTAVKARAAELVKSGLSEVDALRQARRENPDAESALSDISRRG